MSDVFDGHPEVAMPQTEKHSKHSLLTMVLFLFVALVAIGTAAFIFIESDADGDEKEDDDVVVEEGKENKLDDPVNNTIMNTQNFQEAQLSFALNIFLEIQKSNPEENTFLSPASIAMALTMALNGSDKETRGEMESVLGIEGFELMEVNDAYTELIRSVGSKDKNVELAIANSLWMDDAYDFQDEFLSVSEESYDARLEALDFQDPQVKETINQWVEDQTNGKIKDLISEVSPTTIMYLINAIYFNGEWTKEFNPDNTEEESFYIADGSDVTVQMMQSETEEYLYAESSEYQVATLPYGNGAYDMVLILPSEASDLENFMANLYPSKWTNIIDSLEKKEGTIELPRFKVEFGQQLNEILTTLGMPLAFEPALADFTKIYKGDGENLYISKVMHKAFIEVNEKGTEAAAATSVEFDLMAAAPDDENRPFYMVLDRPFLYAIRDVDTGMILFMGTMWEPGE